MQGGHGLRPGDHVLWAPPDDGATDVVPLAHGHPGQVAEPVGDLTASVVWVDREGPLALEGAFDVTCLVRVSAEDFEARAAAVGGPLDAQSGGSRRC
jgi:hypothetical protein